MVKNIKNIKNQKWIDIFTSKGSLIFKKENQIWIIASPLMERERKLCSQSMGIAVSDMTFLGFGDCTTSGK